MAVHFKPGDCVIYRKQKFSAHPGPNARNLWPAANGDHYTYFIDKFYRVVALETDDRIVVVTRRGRRRTLVASDSALRRARWWHRVLLRRPFPSLAVVG
jgi:hypothetical protein